MAAYDITMLGSATQIATVTTGGRGTSAPLSTTRYVMVWQDTTTVKNVQTVEVDRVTGAVTPNGSPLNFYSTSYDWGSSPTNASIAVIDATHFAVFWTGSGDDGFCRTFEVNAGTGAVTAWGAQVEYDTTQGTTPSALLMSPSDGTNARILNTWTGSGSDGFASIFTVTMSDGTIAVTGTPFEFDNDTGIAPSVSKISTTKAIVSYLGTGADGYSRVLDVNTSTWAVTGAGSSSSFRTSNATTEVDVLVVSPTPLVAVVNSVETTVNDTDLQSLSINTSTWAVSNLGSSIEIADNNNNNGQPRMVKIDDTHFLSAVEIATPAMDIRTYTLDSSTGGLTQNDSEQVIATNVARMSVCDMGSGLYVASWFVNNTSMSSRTFQVELPSTDSGSFFAVM